MLMSLSFGVMACMMISIVIALCFNYQNILRQKKSLWIISFAAAFFLLFVLVNVLFPGNPVAQRLHSILNLKDTSMKGRTYDAFLLAYQLAKQRSLWFGIGFGQIKVLGHDMIINYYQYFDTHPVVRIPNSVAETLAMFGVTGVLFRLGLEAFLFWRFKVWNNHFRLALFIFIFIYQFTGSYQMNIAELVPWVMAISTNFKVFDRKAHLTA
jgi:hypothetical protein